MRGLKKKQIDRTGDGMATGKRSTPREENTDGIQSGMRREEKSGRKNETVLWQTDMRRGEIIVRHDE